MNLTSAEKEILFDLGFSTVGGTTFYGSAVSLYQAVALYIFREDIRHPAVDSFREAYKKLMDDEDASRLDAGFQDILMSYKELK